MPQLFQNVNFVHYLGDVLKSVHLLFEIGRVLFGRLDFKWAYFAGELRSQKNISDAVYLNSDNFCVTKIHIKRFL